MKLKVVIRLGLVLFYLFIAVNCWYGDRFVPKTPFSQALDSVVPTLDTAVALPPKKDEVSKTVYICQSTAAKRYHYSQNCKGLRHCTHTIVKTNVREAEAVGLTPCRLE